MARVQSQLLLGQRRWAAGMGGAKGGEAEAAVRSALRGVIEPVTGRSLTSIGAVRSIIASPDSVRLELDLFVPGYPHEAQVRTDCEARLKAALPWAERVEVKAVVGRGAAGANSKVACLSRVQHVVLVSSCKGGVGKSTVSVNLAMTLAKRGLKVALLDADIYGPSLPLLVTPVDATVRRVPDKPGFIQPLETKEGLKVLSFGHVNPKAATGAGGKGAAVMRGPIATRVINQLIAATEWSDLDYLVIDMPPGTGDIQITVTQTVSASGAVLVTTPHPLSLADSAKGLAMFEDLKIKPLAIVENMAYFECDHGKVYYPFGLGGRDNFAKVLERSWKEGRAQGKGGGGGAEVGESLEILSRAPMHKIPLSSEISGSLAANQSVVDFVTDPIVVRQPLDKIAKIYSALADDVIREILRQLLDAQIMPSITYSEQRGGVVVLRYFEAAKVSEFIIPRTELRTRDAKTGKKLASPLPSIEKDVKPVAFDFKGNYGVAIAWSDGHYADIWPFEVLRELALELA